MDTGADLAEYVEDRQDITGIIEWGADSEIMSTPEASGIVQGEDEELADYVEEPAVGVEDPPTRKRICRFYNTKRGCRKEDSCDFLHKKLPCAFFASDRGCNLGDTCSFLHNREMQKPSISYTDGTRRHRRGSRGLDRDVASDRDHRDRPRDVEQVESSDIGISFGYGQVCHRRDKKGRGDSLFREDRDCASRRYRRNQRGRRDSTRVGGPVDPAEIDISFGHGHGRRRVRLQGPLHPCSECHHNQCRGVRCRECHFQNGSSTRSGQSEPSLPRRRRRATPYDNNY